MDYSKLTPEQLLEILKTQSPRMYDALSTPLDYPEEFPFYDRDAMSDLGKVSSELYNDPNNLDSRLDLFINMLNYNPGAINGNEYGHSNAIDAVNYATHGNQMGIENSLANASSQIYDFPTTTAAWNAKAGYGLPLWYAKMKGLVK